MLVEHCAFLAAAEAELAARSAAFAAAFPGRKLSAADIEADEAWHALYERRKALEREAAAPCRVGGCSFWIARRRRFCSNAAADGLGGLCSEHAAKAAAAVAAAAAAAAGADEAAAAAAAEAAAPAVLLHVLRPSAPAVLLPHLVDGTAHAGSLKRNLKNRLRRLTNPQSYRETVEAPDWASVFADPSLPTLLDLGCAKGRFLCALSGDATFAARYGAHNFVGVEIFAPLVTAANAWRDTTGRRNLHFISANATAASLSALRVPNLRRVAIQFPDPWFGSGHDAARRMVTPELCEAIADTLPLGGEVFVATDVLPLALEMRALLLGTGRFALHELHRTAAEPEGWGQGWGQSPDPRAGGGEAGGEEAAFHPGGEEGKAARGYVRHRRIAAKRGEGAGAGKGPGAGGGAGDGEVQGEGEAAVAVAQEAGAAAAEGEAAAAAAVEGGWLRVRPFGLPTERDKVCEVMWRPIYRTLLVRTCNL